MAPSISSASRTLTGLTSNPRDGATAWMAPNWPSPADMAGSRRMAARVTLGAISLSNSSHFPLMPYSNWTNPVALPPGRARLLTKPAPTGSGTITNTIGTVRVACSNGAAAALPVARMTSGESATSSAASKTFGVTCWPAAVDPHIVADGPTELLQALVERRDPSLTFWIVCGGTHKHTDTPHPLGLLRPCCERPRRRAAE